MKKVFLFLACALSWGIAMAQTEDPKGLYRLQKFSYDNMPDKIPSFEQYKFCDENVTLTVYVSDDEFEKGGKTVFRMYKNDSNPFRYTGKGPMGADGKGIQLYDSNKKGFVFRWYNSNLRDYIYFPYHEFTNEHYTTKGISKAMKETQKILRMQLGKKKNNFYGVWRRRGSISTYAMKGDGEIYQMPEMYKIYSEKNVLVMWAVRDSYQDMYASCELRPYKCLSGNVIQENITPCTITWIDENTYTLAWIDENGSMQGEIWDRCGLPENFQKMFGTNVAINKVEIPERKAIYHDADILIGHWRNQSAIGNTDFFFEKDGKVRVEYTDMNGVIQKMEDEYSIENGFIRYKKASAILRLCHSDADVEALNGEKKEAFCKESFFINQSQETKYDENGQRLYRTYYSLWLKSPNGLEIDLKQEQDEVVWSKTRPGLGFEVPEVVEILEPVEINEEDAVETEE